MLGSTGPVIVKPLFHHLVETHALPANGSHHWNAIVEPHQPSRFLICSKVWLNILLPQDALGRIPLPPLF